MELNLKNKVALVCGSTQGIGRAAAMALASEGVKVTLLARNEAKLKLVLSELPKTAVHDYIVADFSKIEELQLNVSDYINKNPGFHILINNTGGPRSGSIINATLEQFECIYIKNKSKYNIKDLTILIGYGLSQEAKKILEKSKIICSKFEKNQINKILNNFF